MANVKTERGSVLMETVIMIPIITLIFTFIWEFSLQARDQLFVAEIGLSVVRLLAQHTDSPSKRESIPDPDKKYLDHRTYSYKIAPVENGDWGNLGLPGREGTLQIRDWAQGDPESPWTMIVAGRAWYKGSNAPEKRPLWMDLGVILSEQDARGSIKPEVRATVARLMTYSLARTAMSYRDDYPRHCEPKVLAHTTKQWYCDRAHPYVHLPNVEALAVGQKTWVSLASTAANPQRRNDISPGRWDRSSMDGYERNHALDIIAKAEP